MGRFKRIGFFVPQIHLQLDSSPFLGMDGKVLHGIPFGMRTKTCKSQPLCKYSKKHQCADNDDSGKRDADDGTNSACVEVGIGGLGISCGVL
jgi:hypothetical protein